MKGEMKCMWIVVDISLGKVDGYYASKDGECGALCVAEDWSKEHPTHTVVVAQISDGFGAKAIPEDVWLANYKP